MKTKIAGIYYIKNLINGKFYLGSSWDIARRWKAHRSKYNKGIGDNPHLQSAWNKYGADNFEFSVIKTCKDEDVLHEEQLELDIHFGKDYCYNLDGIARRNIWTRDKCKVSRKQTDSEKKKRSESIKKTLAKRTKKEWAKIRKKALETKGGLDFVVTAEQKINGIRKSIERNQSEEGREKNRQGQFNRWNDPIKRDKTIQAMKKSWSKRLNPETIGMTPKEYRHYHYLKQKQKKLENL